MSVLVLSLTCVAYTYAGHPVLLWILARLRPRPWRQAPITPSVGVYVSAFNEEKAIAAKLENLLVQEYAGELTIIVANDGSTDGTARIVRSLGDARIRLWDFERNRGKAAMQNEIVPQLACEIVVFTDSTSWLPRDALAKIVRHFADPRVGAVSTDVRFLRRRDHGVERGQGAYWRYERFLRTQGARAGTNVVCSGTCYAIRRALFREIPLDVGEDLANPINVAFAGFRVVFDPDTCVEEESSATHAAELRMRRRVAVRNLTALVRYRRYLHPRFGFAAFQLAVHKYLRCLCWLPMAAAFVANALLAGQPAFGALFGAQCLGYGLALAGWASERRGRSVRVLYVPYYFFLMNFAYALAAADYLRGVRRASWQTDR
jgi:cellulose synthase/poly-beta-1,6-N-acetylglucosamine synthase-like glycosyltransferase